MSDMMASTPTLTGGRTDTAANAKLIEIMPVPVAKFYKAFLSGDVDAMLDMLHPAVRVRFPSYRATCDLETVRRVFQFQSTLFRRMDFQLVDVFTSGAVTLVIWRESGITADGRDWNCHGVDAIYLCGGVLHTVEVGGSGRSLIEEMPRYEVNPSDHFYPTTGGAL